MDAGKNRELMDKDYYIRTCEKCFTKVIKHSLFAYQFDETLKCLLISGATECVIGGKDGWFSFY